ncbi:hypothetical protein C2E25_11640 [Geothermobacter hydrogeniphilus]|uniref:Cache domain-containing protein n=1 Tax=Geothermobacter hydrogeniphilus TaxID=1969733 RepID=A0A2K2H8E7_9BACT|nr:cache domain-containing protein [Geothermobacter hydrogeniphilus]PNU19585.1 hypothetical protein C2E25_11640 [Geothermobacter hydrogeniphilus]
MIISRGISSSSGGKVEFRLVVWLCLLLVVLVGGLLGVFSFLGQRARSEMTVSMVRQAASVASRRFQRQIEGSHRLLETLSGWGREGLLVAQDVDGLRRKLLPLVENFPAIAGLSLADDEGRDFFLARNQGGWLVRHSRGSGAPQHWQFWKGGTLQRQWDAAESFDPRQRIWYQPARKQPGTVVWSGLYRFHTLKRFGVSASIAWQGKRGFQVAAIDLLIDDLVKALRVPELGESGVVFSVSRDGLLNDLASGPASSENRQLLAAYRKVRRPEDSVTSFSLLGTTWYAGEEQVSLDNARVRIGILVPESEINPGLSGVRRQFLAVAAVILLIGILALLFVLRRFRRHFVPAVTRPDAAWLQAVISPGRIQVDHAHEP